MQRALRRPRTVMFLHGSSGGYGADRQLELLATGLDPSRYRPLVVLPEHGELGARLEESGVELAIAPLAVLRRCLRRGSGAVATAGLLTRNVRLLGALARQRRVSIVHSNYSLVLCGQGVANRASAAHFLHVREIYSDALWPLLRRRLLRADAVACVSDAVADRFPPSERVFVVRDGIRASRTRVARDDARRALGLAPEAFVVATLGRISDWKGQDVLLRALADPLLSDVDAVALVAGDAAPRQGHFEAALADLARSLSLDGRVRLLGFRDDVDVLLAAADAVAVPSTYPDSLPNSAIEAAAAGLPVVATDTGGQREIVEDGVTGRIVPPGDARALAAALRDLAEDPLARARLGRAATARARARFDSAHVLDEVQSHYDRLIASRAVGPPAWLLPVKRLPVAHPAAPDLRIARQASWLEALGYRPVVLGRKGLLSAPALVLRALRERPALVLAAAAVHGPALAALRRVRGTATLADVIGLHSLELDQASSRRARGVLRAVWAMLESVFVRAADAALAVNDRHASLVQRRYRPRRVVTLRDTADDVATVAAVARRTLGLTEDSVAIGFAGSLVYGRLDALFDVWSDVPPGLSLVVAGDGPELERYRRRAAAAGWLGRTVHLLGGLPHEQALATLAACDVGYSDCWSDAGFPAKVFEYLALGLPVVTEATSQAAEVLEHGRTALLYRSPDELRDQLQRLARDPELRRRLGEAGRRAYLVAHTAAHRQLELEAIVDGLVDRLAVRPLEPGDVKRLFGRRSRAYGDEWLERHARGNAYVAVATLDGVPVGRVALDFARITTSGAAYLSSGYVKRTHRSRGIGSALCHHLEDVARDRGYRTIQLGVNKDNRHARRLYARLGFQVCGEEVVRWTYRRLGRTVEVVEDCAAMRKELYAAAESTTSPATSSTVRSVPSSDSSSRRSA